MSESGSESRAEATTAADASQERLDTWGADAEERMAIARERLAKRAAELPGPEEMRYMTPPSLSERLTPPAVAAADHMDTASSSDNASIQLRTVAARRRHQALLVRVQADLERRKQRRGAESAVGPAPTVS